MIFTFGFPVLSSPKLVQALIIDGPPVLDEYDLSLVTDSLAFLLLLAPHFSSMVSPSTAPLPGVGSRFLDVPPLVDFEFVKLF
jgi:hypothetical protein